MSTLSAWHASVCLACVFGCVERGEVLTKQRPPQTVGIDAAVDTTSSRDDSDDPGTAVPSTSTPPAESSNDTSSTPSPTDTMASDSSEAGTPAIPSQSSSTDVGVPDAEASPTSVEPELDAGPPMLVTEPATRISSGGNHACAVFTSGIACWGSNASGQLGLGDAIDRSVPSLLPNTSGWPEVHAAGEHTCAIDTAGSVWCWGANDRGQLATGDRQSRPTPVEVSLPAPAVGMASRFNHACALSNEGALYCWGENFEGEIGQEDAFPGDQNPTAADALSALRVAGEWTEVDTGQGHTCAIASEGSLWCWGRNTGSELGGGTEIQVRAPQRVDDALDWAELTSGQASNLALKDDGSLWGWGNNVGYGNGEGAPLGVPTEGVPTPTRVGDQIGWLAPSTRIFHSCALRSDELWCWGRNIEGQLGLGDHELRTEPALVGSGYIEVSAAGFGTCAVSNTGVVACTGKNDVGELGTGDAVRRAEFTAVRGFAR